MSIVSALYIYPVKSLGGFSVAEARITATGFEHDRRWMLVDSDGKFITQRQLPAMALLQTAITANGIYVYHKHFPDTNITIPFLSSPAAIKKVQIFDDYCDAWCYPEAAVNNWFSAILNTDCELVYMPDDTQRLVDTVYAKNNEITSFSDGYPILIIGQASLDLLNSKLTEPLPMERFRPNIVFTGGTPNIEDSWKQFRINEIDFSGVKTSARCIIPTINQETAEAGKEPLRTLATYRSVDNKIKFGMNLLHKGLGSVKVGDMILVHEQK